MFSIVLFEPQIPPNTGNIIRLCANTGCNLHLIEPLGFSLDEKQMRRAGLDYHNDAKINNWANFKTFRAHNRGRLISLSTRDKVTYSDFQFEPGDLLMFGSETKGLSDEVREQVNQGCRLHIPMQETSRSLNLSNSVAIVVYEAWRQQSFKMI